MNEKLVVTCFEICDKALKMGMGTMSPEYLDEETVQQFGAIIAMYNELRNTSLEWAKAADHSNKIDHDLRQIAVGMLKDQSKRLEDIEAKLDKMADKAE